MNSKDSDAELFTHLNENIRFTNKTVIFDLDDTLIDTANCYEKVLKELCSRMKKIFSVEADEVLAVQEKFDSEFWKTAVFDAERFPKSFTATYKHFCKFFNKMPNEKIEKEFEDLGWSVYKMIPDLKNGALELLEALKSSVELWLYTLGDESIQRSKIERHSLGNYFQHIHIVPSKSKDVLKSLINGSSKMFAMVGDSLRFEINPALELGLFAVHVKNNYEWKLQKAPVISDNYVSVKNLREAQNILETNFISERVVE
ncbi:MAG: hypothetical protein AUJ18_00100 [Candidatus Hydrogenedentes bacterium CG1_02_42_14]|nr:MAG: hypothetical protein AUJ18_00100 [Candidatus Hydrogenedentes bacterium CG1_02_42_14]